MNSTIFEKDRYIAPFDYLISKDIREYDISKGNISVLFCVEIESNAFLASFNSLHFN